MILFTRHATRMTGRLVRTTELYVPGEGAMGDFVAAVFEGVREAREG